MAQRKPMGMGQMMAGGKPAMGMPTGPNMGAPGAGQAQRKGTPPPSMTPPAPGQPGPFQPLPKPSGMEMATPGGGVGMPMGGGLPQGMDPAGENGALPPDLMQLLMQIFGGGR